MFYIIICIITGILLYTTKTEKEFTVIDGGENKVSLVLAWYDLWIGYYRNRDSRTSYIFILPGIGFSIKEK